MLLAMSLADAPLAPSRRQRLQRLLVEFGPLGVAVHFTVYGLVLVSMGLWLSRHRGTSGGAVGTWAAAYVATKLILPLRAALTLAITPPLRRWWIRRAHAKKATVERTASGL
jgi:hypothetical protein